MAADRWRTGDSTDDPGTASDRVPWAADRRRGPEPRIGDDQPPKTTSGDVPRTNPDGTWEWKGHRLEAADNEVADRGLDRRREAEPAITRDMRAIEARLPHGRLDGCPEHTLKTPDRFKEKLARQIGRNPDVPTDEVEVKIHDGIRYTFSIDDARYTAGVAQVHQRLGELGYELRWQKNRWDNLGYKGINSRWVEPHSGETIEIQFHTPTGAAVNRTTHDAYQEIENPQTDPSRRQALRTWRRQQADTIPVPPGARGIADYMNEDDGPDR